MRTVRISQCYDARFIDGTAVEVEVFEPDHHAIYMIGAALERGETTVRPCAVDVAWVLDGSLLDAIEDLQAGMCVCDECRGTGRIERQEVGIASGGALSVEDCDVCDGKGWL